MIDMPNAKKKYFIICMYLMDGKIRQFNLSCLGAVPTKAVVVLHPKVNKGKHIGFVLIAILSGPKGWFTAS